ncbi:MAG: hypothetical protein UU48_C0006G0105 [Candidatus Uhrbacteria bacterium GW2011_GWF2_41_16]|uniref:Uncharacterized protein n=2 Tax=Candidatus Uhriibacteriota TaxID=1752732 RepID=A0A0G0XMP2_9BACT|nr:MAG: hypothetical protein UU35_C0007G0027 [Candidatus Uhrbacteria bacterium GW2011_GWC2_41_11]KKR98065.1 MAG: hypothetical protein UU48_C0006G0105 [Candidatus Uhrbacteria bacterium GW2011_GWF2_41_16]
MSLNRMVANARQRERNNERRSRCREAIDECLRAVRGVDGATFDDFHWIQNRITDPVVSAALRDENVSLQEYVQWEAAYKADTPNRNARELARKCEEAQSALDDFRKSADWFDQEDLISILEYRHLVGDEAFCIEFHISQDELEKIDNWENKDLEDW